MSRKQEGINPEAGFRLKSILAEKGISQKDFAARFRYTEQHISQIVRGKRRLTYETAQRIIKEFPEYRVEWLMGYDGDKTVDDHINSSLAANARNGETFFDFIKMIAIFQGYKIRFMKDEKPAVKSQSPNFYFLITRDGVEVYKCSLEEYDIFRNEVSRYASYLFEKLMCNKEDQISNLYSTEFYVG